MSFKEHPKKHYPICKKRKKSFAAEPNNKMLRHRYAVNNAGSGMRGLQFNEIHNEDLKKGNILFNFIHSPAL